jgi:hypothetical protein
MLVLNFKAHRHLLGSLYVQFHPQNLGLFSDVARYLGLCGTGPGHQVRLPFALISGLDIWRLELIIDEVGMLDVGLDMHPRSLRGFQDRDFGGFTSHNSYYYHCTPSEPCVLSPCRH